MARITGEFAKQVPTRLASGSRVDIGSPGRLSYTVSRGPFQVTLRGSTLHVGTSVSGHAELCKPLGPLDAFTMASATRRPGQMVRWT